MSTPLKKTALFNLHQRMKGRMVPFCGWNMPVQYEGVMAEHRHTRNAIGIFDVSHMGQISVRGPGAEAFVQWLAPVDLASIKPGTSKLSVLMREDAGIIDDTMITKDGADSVYIVLNAGRYDVDMAHITAMLDKFHGNNPNAKVEIERLSEKDSLIALQGPKTMEAVGKHVAGLPEMPFMTSRKSENLHGVPVRFTRCGYTGEDGFEIAVPHGAVEELTSKLLEDPTYKLIGLGARDTLRLEAGLCLYGHELNETITPREAGLMWVITKRRREAGGFIGAEALKAVLEKPLTKTRVGIVAPGGPAAREGAGIFVGEEKVGEVTSGSPSPTNGGNVAQGYMPPALGKAGQDVMLEVRGKKFPGKVAAMPMVSARFYRVPKPDAKK